MDPERNSRNRFLHKGLVNLLNYLNFVRDGKIFRHITNTFFGSWYRK